MSGLICSRPLHFQYLAHRSSPKVKERVIELLFLWSIQIKEMPKIFEAYQMLKKQGIISEDPVHVIPVSIHQPLLVEA